MRYCIKNRLAVAHEWVWNDRAEKAYQKFIKEQEDFQSNIEWKALLNGGHYFD